MNKEGPVEDVKVSGRLSCSDHEMLNFRILCGGSRGISRIKTLDLRRAEFALFKELGRNPVGQGSRRQGGPRVLVAL